MKRFDITRLKEGDILAGRNLVSRIGELIRAILGSTTNHNALIILHNTRGWGIGDMTSPEGGVFNTFEHYERLVDENAYMIRVYRIKDATDYERHFMSLMWQTKINPLPYSNFHVKRLWLMRFVNSLPWTIHGTWCTRAIGIVCAATFRPARNIFRKIFVEGMPLKRNETPRTIENRLVQGLLVDVTDEVFHDDW